MSRYTHPLADLTAEQIKELPASRDTDKLVAEVFLRVVKRPVKAGVVEYVPPKCFRPCDIKYPDGYTSGDTDWYYVPSGMPARTAHLNEDVPVPYFTRRIDWAFQIVRLIHRAGFWVELLGPRSPSGSFHATFFAHLKGAWECPEYRVGIAATPALAIVRASLVWAKLSDAAKRPGVFDPAPEKAEVPA